MGKTFRFYVTTLRVPEKINLKTKIRGAGGGTDTTSLYGKHYLYNVPRT